MLRGTSIRARSTSTASRGPASSRGRGRGASGTSNSLPTTNPPNSFETERLENAAKREQRGQESTAVSARGGRGTSRGRYQNKSVRFASPPIQPPKETTTASPSPFATTNGTSSPFANAVPNVPNAGVTISQPQFNPFAPTSGTVGISTSTSTNTPGWNPFVTASSTETQQIRPFGGTQITNGTPNPSIFGAPSGLTPSFSNPNPFGNPAQPSYQNPTSFTANPFSSSSSNNATSNPLSTFKSSTASNGSNPFLAGAANPQRQLERNHTSLSSQAGVNNPILHPNNPVNPSKNKLAVEVDSLLRKNGIIAPSWPTTTPGDPSHKAIVEAFWQTMKAYRARVRTCLIRNGYLDDPDKPKKLSEAIDFKGTCEDMCPEFEKVTRIVEHDIQSAEKELSPDGQNYWPTLHKMVKALARSAAGQDAPLPEDVRSPAALRRTLDYLIDTVLGTNDLPAIHGFLWDRTRAIRRDFVFQQSSMASQELLDQVYCLEQITRFHVIALHQMSHEDVIVEDFSEQQEVEQLGKALLSLIHAYEDCVAQGIHCDNEPEFRAYYVLFNSHNTGILEAVQDWGWKYWGESDDIRTAVSLVETLQNVWDTQGPLKPHSATDVAQNTYYRFFSIIENPKISYTMACFAEIHFNKVRKAALKTILASYRKQRDQTTDWTLDRLNTYLYFDDENDIVKFGEAYGVHFDVLNGQKCLSFESDDQMEDPFPKLKQPHSYKLVERKRGHHTLSELIHHTVCEDRTNEVTEEDDENSLFVPMASDKTVQHSISHRSSFTDSFPDPLNDPLIDDTPFPDQNLSRSLTQEKREDVKSTKQNNSQGHAVQFQGVGKFAPATNNSSENTAIFGGKSPVAGESKLTGSTSIFENKTVAPQKGIFSFLDQTKTGTFSQASSSNTSSFPTTIENQATEASISTAPPSRSFLSTLGSTGSFPSSLSVPPPAPIANVKEPEFGLETVKEAAKEAPVRTIESRNARSNEKESKQSLTDHPSNNSFTKLADRASIANTPRKSKMDIFSEWVALGDNGIIDQFTEAAVEDILRQTVQKYVADEKRRHLQEEDKHAREEAARFRFNFLATKYFYTWRDIAHRLWMRRKGRLARQARRQMAEESFRTSHTIEKRDIIDEFRAYGNTKQQNVEQSLTHVKDKPLSPKGSKLVSRPSKKASPVANGYKSSSPGQAQNNNDDPLRKSLLSDSAYLQGGSRIHLVSNYKSSMEGRQPNGVKTDYFRLKARGIMTLPDGTPLANTAAVHLNHKRSLDNMSESLTPERPINKPTSSSVPSKQVTSNVSHPRLRLEHENEIEALKARARVVMAKDKEEKQKIKKRVLDDDEAELFASAKRLREKMDEEILWMKAETQKSLSRSSS